MDPPALPIGETCARLVDPRVRRGKRVMPLSENEQNILDEIERHLHQTDPDLVREVGETTVYGHALSSLRWSVVGLLAGLIVMLGTLQIHFLIAFGGFLLMLLSGMGLERNFRLMGRAGLNQVSSAIRANAAPSQAEPEAADE